MQAVEREIYLWPSKAFHWFLGLLHLCKKLRISNPSCLYNPRVNACFYCFSTFTRPFCNWHWQYSPFYSFAKITIAPTSSRSTVKTFFPRKLSISDKSCHRLQYQIAQLSSAFVQMRRVYQQSSDSKYQQPSCIGVPTCYLMFIWILKIPKPFVCFIAMWSQSMWDWNSLWNMLV